MSSNSLDSDSAFNDYRMLAAAEVARMRRHRRGKGRQTAAEIVATAAESEHDEQASPTRSLSDKVGAKKAVIPPPPYVTNALYKDIDANSISILRSFGKLIVQDSGKESSADDGQRTSGPLTAPLFLSTLNYKELLEDEYELVAEYPTAPKLNIADMRPTLKSAFEGAIDILRWTSQATSHVIYYPLRNDEECGQLVQLARDEFNLEAVGLRQKYIRNYVIVLYKQEDLDLTE